MGLVQRCVFAKKAGVVTCDYENSTASVPSTSCRRDARITSTSGGPKQHKAIGQNMKITLPLQERKGEKSLAGQARFVCSVNICHLSSMETRYNVYKLLCKSLKIVKLKPVNKVGQ